MKLHCLLFMLMASVFPVFIACEPAENENPNTEDKTIPATSVSISPSSISMKVGETASVDVKVEPKNTTDKTWTWTSDSPETASATGNKVKASAEGDATLTLKVGSKTASLKVHVDKASKGAPDTLEISKEGAVDLGLSVKWAALNLGAESPEEYGNYYSWGESQPRTDIRNYATYKWYSSGYFTKYNTDPKEGSIDGRYFLLPEDDAASVALGAGWRMPTEQEMRDLYFNCTWTSSEYNGVKGYTITGKNGKSIFLPKAGYVNYNESEASMTGEKACFWTSERSSSEYAFAYGDGNSFDFMIKHPAYLRIFGMSVRPVYGEALKTDLVKTAVPYDTLSVSAVSVKLRSYINLSDEDLAGATYGVCYSSTETEPSVSGPHSEGQLQSGTNNVYTTLTGLNPGTSYHYRAYVTVGGTTHYSASSSFKTDSRQHLFETGELISCTGTSARVSTTCNLTDVICESVSFGICFSTNDNPDISSGFVAAEADGTEKPHGSCKANLSGLTPGTKYYWRACLKIDGQVLYGSVKSFTAEIVDGSMKAVDLGLSVSWANMNVGAETVNETGDFFSWGEISQKKEYNFGNYKWYDQAGKNGYTKYGKYSSNDCKFPDNKTVLEASDDAAYAYSGGKFRTPAAQEIKELADTSKVTISKATVNGVEGFRITSKLNSNHIFIPCTGYYANYGGLTSRAIVMIMSSEKGLVNSVFLSFIIEVNYDGKIKTRFEAMPRCQGTAVRGVRVVAN